RMSSTSRKKARTSFGATAPPFIDYLKDILRRYPDGGQILKELIQNADDAQATKVVFIHDERNYGTDNLWAEDLAKYQGPALYAYNNAAFRDDDWEGIQMAGRSVKRNDPNKVGRFGIGFNSVYHITDVPSIFSSGHLGIMDPQEKIFGERNGGFLWSLDDTEDRETLMNMHNQFQPFRDIVSLVSKQEWSKVIEHDKHFDGTIFRFPLRSEASEISDNLYDSNKVVELFDSFIADADLSLLFLKNVTAVSLMHISADGSVNTRLAVKSSVSENVILESKAESLVKGMTRFKSITLNSKDHKEIKWLVTTCTMKQGKVEKLDSLAEKLSFISQVDLAFPINEKTDCSKSRLSCFLPLPNNESNRTGLPVHVNAYFGLTDNRRHIKWQEEDQKHDEHAVWNELLMKEVLPQAYLTIIQDAIKLAEDSVLPVSSVYDLWPDVAQLQHKEKWYDISLDVLHHLFSQNIPILSLAKDERRFITPSEAVFPCNGPTGLDVLAAIKRTLVSRGENLVTLPDRVAQAIKKAYPHLDSLRHVTPAFIRDLLRKTGVQTISKGDKLCLLEYTLSDGKYSELQGLQLLPLCDGSFRSFTKKEEDTALIDSNEFPRVLLPCCKHLFIPEDLSSTCITHLKQLATKNVFKVINIDAYQVAEYTRSHMPKDWLKTGKGLVNWEVGSSQHPPLAWLQEFWTFLNTHFKELSSFTGMPLIPVTSLTPSQPVSLARLKLMSLPQQIAQLVKKVGGTVVKENDWLKHQDLDSYVLSPSPRSVMKVIMNLDPQQVIRELMNASQSSVEELKGYLSSLDALSSSEKDLLSKLPLFQTMKGLRTSAQSKQAVLLNSGLTIPTELPMPDSVVKCATEADRRLLQLLTIHLLDTANAAILLIDSIEDRACSKKDTENTMAWILDHGNVLFSQNQTLKHRCKNLKFIEVNGVLKKTSSFFDPRVKYFKVIFESDFFPSPLYTKTSQMLASLLDMGLMNKEVQASPDHLLRAATLIEKLHVTSQKEAQERADVLLKMLDAHDLLKKFSKEQLECLKRLKWMPCTEAGKAKTQCNDKSLKSSFFCPDEIRHSMYEDIVGLVMPLEGKLSDRLCSTLGLKRIPPAEKVVENLSALISKAQKMTDPDTNVDFKRMLRSIYEHMQNHISEFATLMNKDTKWLWNHDKFVSPQDLVLEHPHNLDLSSYIGKVPNEFLPYKKLLLEFGLKTSLTDEEIIAILHSIKQTIEGREQPVATSSEVRASIEILNWLWKEKKRVQDDIPVPVTVQGGHCTLKPRSMTVFCDVSRNGLQELKYSQEEIYVVHEEILTATAEWLNIQFLSTYIPDPELVGIEQCGQSEPITTRIKNILKEYDEESDIFKEIIQNAEDAGAEACKFLVDFRMHKDSPESLIDPDMSLCQGPCIWAFNDKQFTADDWDNIVRVGAASKENKVEKIGKFGLGFNTVYHVTDIPSILSGRSLLILDPNVTHLTKHIKHKTNPGIKLDLSQQRLFSCFPGQFGPYERIFGCSFTRKSPPAHYPGTLIKLPFRTHEEALKSEISTKVYYNQDVITFQQHFSNNSQSHLLFLKKINTVSLQNISNNASTPPRDDEIQTVFTVSKTTVSTMKIPEESCVSKQRQAEQSLMELDRKCKDVIDCTDVSIVEITREQSGETQVQYWLLYNCFGTNESLKMAINKNKKVTFSLPIGGIAVPLQNNPETGKFEASQTKVVGQAFCFLPLSIHTGLPVNINGTFAVTSNRKGLWESGVKHEWNKALLQDPVVTAYVTALSMLKNMSENKQLENYCYYTFWPDREKVSETFKPLVDAFYSTIAQHSIAPQLFSNGKKWCSMKNAIFLDASIEEDKNISTLAMQVCEKYMKNNNLIIPLPMWVRNSFKQAGLGNVLQDRTWNWETFYREAVFVNLANMDPKWRDTLILHAIDLNLKAIDSLLVHYHCIPTTSGQLQHINKLVNPSGKVACLFEQEEGRLLRGTISDFCSPKRIQRLMELGMATDELSLEDIAVKAETITKTWITDKTKAYGRLKCLLQLMNCHISDEDSPSWATLRMTEFLPAFSPGDAKMERDVTLKRPTDVFSDKCALLVSMTQPVLDHSNLKIHNSDHVLQVLGVHNSPPSEVVIQQLKEAHKQSQSIDKSVLHKIAFECYKFLDQRLCDSENATSISQSANSFPFVLVGNTFVNLDRVAEKQQFEATPYLHVLPPAFSNFRTLWENVGVEKKFTLSQCLTVLHELHTKHRKKPLPKNDLEICLTILNRGIYEANEETPGDCPVPNEHGVLQPARELFFNDSQWMPVTSGVILCHKKIPRVMALHFGIKTTRHNTLQNHVNESISPFAFQFQQQEQLTVRIKNIISAYPAKKDILKELIQNADDAEATEIHFVWDKRHHSTEKTFGDKWKPLQGPALCVFNDKVFSDDDLAGIQQLGEGGKHNSPGKTGKYGLGFNSVYHLTDCPSVLTGDELLCISDPNQSYIESSSEISPAGIGYKLADIFKKMYIDVYNSFLPDKFPLKKGTMFRLPLRVGTLADSSKISQHAVTDHDMKELCSALSEDPEGLILFLKNICKITVHEINESGKLHTIFAVEKHLPNSSREEKDTFVKLLQQAMQLEKPAAPHKAIYQILISTSNKRESNWIIAEQFGSFKNSDEQKIKSTAKLPHAAVAARVGLKSSAPEPPSVKGFIGEAFSSLPLPGKTGLPVHVNGNFEVDSSRRGLWKEDVQSLKSNWNELLKQNVIGPLYADLLHYISRNISVTKVSSAQLESCLYHPYLCFFPTVSKDVGQDWHEMIHEVYRSLKERDLKVIPVLKSSTCIIADWHVKEYTFYWCNITETESTKALYLTDSGLNLITSILEDVGIKLVPFSHKMEQIWWSFRSAGIEVKDVNPSTVQTFLKNEPLNDPTKTDKQLPLPIVDTLIRDQERCSCLLKFCLKDQVPENIKAEAAEPDSTLLDGLPLLLTRDKVLRVFNSKSPKLISRYDSLFIGYEDQFADYQTNGDHIEVLQTLSLVNALTVPCAAKYLRPLIQCFLQKCEVVPENGHRAPSKEMSEWLKSLWKFLTSELQPATSGNDEGNLTLSGVRELFSDCCILPVVCPRLNNKEFLLRMKDMPSVIHFASERDLSSILFKLGLMKLNTVFFNDIHWQLYSLLHSELMDVNDKSSVLDQLYNIERSEFSQLSSDEMNELKGFLNSGVSKSKDNPDYQRKFKSLPLFETINGERVRINGPTEVFILDMSTDTMKRYPDLFTLPGNNIFLKGNLENHNLSETLTIQTLSKLEYFVKFILPIVHKLTDRQMFHCLKLLVSLKHDYNYSDFKDKIITSLKTVKLIRSSLGNLEMASYYFDDSVELYKKMLPEDRFVPETFWTEFLTDIEFIFPVEIKKELCDYHQPFAAGRTAVKIRGSLIDSEQKHQELIWSSMPIIHLPCYKSSEILKTLKDAGALEQPPSQCVTTNMSNICQSPCRNEKLIETRADVFRSSYEYLQTNEFKSQQLAGLPVVLVEKDKELVRTDNASLSLPHDLEFRPYLYNIPRKFAIYKDFFKKIGVTQKPTAAQYCNVLAAVHKDSHDKQELNPNQEKTVKRAVEQLFKLLKNEGNQSLNAVKTLYLPAVDGKLIESCELYYNNTAYEARRLEEALRKKVLLLQNLSECHLGKDIFEHHRLLQLLPQKFRPKMLSEFTEERLVESHMELCEWNCDFSGWFDQHLSSSHLRHGVICLIRAQSDGKITQEDATNLWDKTFGSIQITCCESLKTELWLDNQPLKNTARETKVFVKQGKETCIFYLKHSDVSVLKVMNEVCGTLAKKINALLGNQFSSDYVMALEQLLMCDSLEDVQQILAKNQIHDSVETESFLRKPPAPGTEIPEEWHDSLDMDTLNNFEEGEYVGYYTSDKYIYAIIVEELPGLSGPYSWKYKIDIGKDEPIEVGRLDLYQFKCKKKPTPEKWTESSCMMQVPLYGAEPHSSQQSSTRSSSSSSSSRSTPATLDKAKREIYKCLADIWTLPKEDRNKAIKRLYLRWHPDKNPGCKQLATEAFMYLQNRIDELTTGKSKAKSSGSSYGRTSDAWDDFKDFFRQWNEEARHHRHGRERFFRRNRSYNFWTHYENVPRPNKEEAQRWFKQARCDLNATQKDTGGGSTEWCLFKVHQAVEKSLIAAGYKKHGKRPIGTTISDMATQVSSYSDHLRTLPQIVRDLKMLGVHPKKTQYPNCHPTPRIPNEMFKSEDEKQALDKASELLNKVEAYVN
uniref:HEPN domain-containing protein n=1 Tax=Sphaeramia orbicularis TaxID=375764 RepID=A0A673B8G1_9TELE